jgi:hypothetical protein
MDVARAAVKEPLPTGVVRDIRERVEQITFDGGRTGGPVGVKTAD